MNIINKLYAEKHNELKWLKEEIKTVSIRQKQNKKACKYFLQSNCEDAFFNCNKRVLSDVKYINSVIDRIVRVKQDIRDLWGLARKERNTWESKRIYPGYPLFEIRGW